ncbi:T9SS type A sorting domain-containing protein [Flagellimonas sp. HMM57]|uniref:T9SS type A sorting domain-containing protein n=1 Tax=unclassified Flagellimonas TaxID=2644544 RepID=UPI0013D5837B|nr:MULTISPECIES: T9SS type A sorting domain-containing protein [unclassified Flagellimonas]UII77353.1 T9SS type A sorting domain-containing protein [Flagellimonas sp. HMM57]
MKQKLLLFGMLWIFSLTAAMAQSQYKIQFSYDSAGNQTLRDRVCVNCGTSKQALDSTLVEEVALQEDILEELSGLNEGDNFSNIVAYPNPVTEQLTVQWQDNQKQVAQIVLFNGIGQQLFQKVVQNRQGSMNLNFGIYPAGRYMVSVFYTDNTKQTFHVIKK